MHIAHLAGTENELLASLLKNELCFILREDVRSAIVLLGQFLLPLQHFARKANDHIVLVGLSVNRDAAERCAFDFHGSSMAIAVTCRLDTKQPNQAARKPACSPRPGFWCVARLATAVRLQLDQGIAGSRVQFRRWETQARREVPEDDWGSPAGIEPPSPEPSCFLERRGMRAHALR